MAQVMYSAVKMCFQCVTKCRKAAGVSNSTVWTYTNEANWNWRPVHYCHWFTTYKGTKIHNNYL